MTFSNSGEGKTKNGRNMLHLYSNECRFIT